MSDAYDIYHIFNQAQSHMHRSEENHCTDVVCREGVIPIVFAPGVMGSNIINTETDEKWLGDSNLTLASWVWKGANARKKTLDPQKTQVYPNGAIEEGVSATWHDANGNPISNDKLLKARGWGEVAKRSYGEFLVWLENQLNSAEQHNPTLTGKILRQCENDGGSTEEVENNVNARLMALRRFHFPVHVCGYNWLKSNADSAAALASRVDTILEKYTQAGTRCDKAILVTHSMGGLVARYYSEVAGGEGEGPGQDKVLGIVHGVMPTTGAAVFYRRMKCGTDGDSVVSAVLGNTAEKMTAVLARAPGPLQLVPSPDYGRGWLKIYKDGQETHSLPTGNDPYSEIYLEREHWWGMMDSDLAVPEFSNSWSQTKQKAESEKAWETYHDIVAYQVKNFHKNIQSKFNSNTYMFYSDSREFMSYGTISWSGSPYISGAQAMMWGVDESTVHRYPIETGAQGRSTRYEYTVSDHDEPGDGTVPLRSGQSGVEQAKRSLTIPTEHEPAYNNQDARWFTLCSILEVASQSA